MSVIRNPYTPGTFYNQWFTTYALAYKRANKSTLQSAYDQAVRQGKDYLNNSTRQILEHDFRADALWIIAFEIGYVLEG